MLFDSQRQRSALGHVGPWLRQEIHKEGRGGRVAVARRGKRMGRLRHRRTDGECQERESEQDAGIADERKDPHGAMELGLRLRLGFARG